jgi:hypothetical protein
MFIARSPGPVPVVHGGVRPGEVSRKGSAKDTVEKVADILTGRKRNKKQA